MRSIATISLSVEIDDGCVTLSQRNQGRLFPGTCQQMPDWRAGEWHHLAVTWSASANRMAVTYDCAQTVTGDYRALSGIADVFYLGSDAAGQTLDAALDDVRLSRRALTANEVAAICRDRPLPHDQVPLPVCAVGACTIGHAATDHGVAALRNGVIHLESHDDSARQLPLERDHLDAVCLHAAQLSSRTRIGLSQHADQSAGRVRRSALLRALSRCIDGPGP